MVVVGDDEIDAELARERGLAHGGDAAVDGHDDARPIRGELAERLAVEAVPLLVAVRDVRADDRAELAERTDEDRRAGDAVDVVVPVDDDALASRERTVEALDRPVQIAHRRALIRRDPGRQEVRHLPRADAPPREDPRDERGDTIGDIPDPLCGHDPATLRHEAHPTFKYPALVLAIGLALASCVPPATRAFVLSAPEYVVWTLDFEGDASGDAELANTAAIADGLRVPMTIMWNPRVWTTTQVSPARAEAMLAWTKARGSAGDEIALHLHMWTDYVRAAGLVPRTVPSWAGRLDGYDVPMTAYNEIETRTLLDHALRLMADHGLSRPLTFRAGGDFANAENLRAVAAAGFVADCTAVPAGTFGRLTWPWTLAPDAQPYRPSRDDANKPGDLALLEAPTIGGNTYGYDARTIQPIARADLSYLAAAGQPAKERRAITIVSHPGTIDASERAGIEALLGAFAPLRYDRDTGPLRFVTLAQLAKAYGL